MEQPRKEDVPMTKLAVIRLFLNSKENYRNQTKIEKSCGVQRTILQRKML
jgi:hypothetical protein